jgi:hypothetical protein
MPATNTTRDLWCMDRNPAEVDYEWIKQNAYKAPGQIRIGSYILGTSGSPGRIWMKDPSGQVSEMDEKVLEDVLRSFF